jgi:hypothetical protein
MCCGQWRGGEGTGPVGGMKVNHSVARIWMGRCTGGREVISIDYLLPNLTVRPSAVVAK